MLPQPHHVKSGASGSVTHGEVIFNPVRDIGWVTLEMASERWDGNTPLRATAQDDDMPIAMTLTEAA
jgi:hypothetical protein